MRSSQEPSADATSDWAGRLRAASGVVLFAYVVTHLSNHALGLISLDAMQAGRVWFLALWRNALGTTLLYGALLSHFGLALRALFRRRHLRMPAWEAVQMGLGLLIPPILILHVVATRVTTELFGATDSYARIIFGYWVLRPDLGAAQAAFLTVVWTHGCIGLHYWLRLKPWYPRVALPLFAGAVLLPTLALLGFVHAGREVSVLARQPDWVGATLGVLQTRDPARDSTLARIRMTFWGGYASALGLVLLARGVRRVRERHRGLVRVRYPGERDVVIPAGMTVLEASRLARIPHASVCGGRGRCSTCRVRVVRGLDELPPPSHDERRVLQRIGAPPNVRLACQLRPTANLAVIRLLPATASARDGFSQPSYLAGQEQQITVLFADLRGFTGLAEDKFPYDLVFFLNRYFEAVGRAVEQHGGIVSQFRGDGVVALFGVNATTKEGCRRALLAAASIARNVEELGAVLSTELKSPLRIGFGIHSGPAVVGRMGYADSMGLTAVGDTLSVASRLQDLTKEYACQLIISQDVADCAGVDASAWPLAEASLRGRGAPKVIRIIDDARRVGEAIQLEAEFGS